jgi:nucleoside-diphosphate-sugar epimerase
MRGNLDTMKIVVTGGSGYLGTKLVNVLSSLDYEVTSFDSAYFSHCWLGPKTSNTEQLLFAQSIVPSNLEGIDVVIHLAGISNDPLKQITESELYDPSLDYTLKLAKLCRDMQIRFFYASSCSVYGKQNVTADENSPISPQTPYSANKENIEKILLGLATEDWKPLILRFATVYGPSPRMRFDTVVNMFCGLSIVESCIALNSNGEAQRPFLFIEDGIAVIEWFLRLNGNSFRQVLGNRPIFNVGTDESNISINGLAQLVSALSGNVPIKSLTDIENRSEVLQDRKIREGVDSRSYRVSFDKLRNVLPNDFVFCTLGEGITRTIDYLKFLPLDSDTFYSKQYYRLQYLEKLIDERKLDHSLNYIN